MTEPGLSLADGLRLLRLSESDLWARCAAIGGDISIEQLREHITSDECRDANEHNVIAQALNEVFLEQGGDHPVGYRHLYRGEFDS